MTGEKTCEDDRHFAIGANITTGNTGAGSGCGWTRGVTRKSGGSESVCELAAGVVRVSRAGADLFQKSKANQILQWRIYTVGKID